VNEAGIQHAFGDDFETANSVRRVEPEDDEALSNFILEEEVEAIEYLTGIADVYFACEFGICCSAILEAPDYVSNACFHRSFLQLKNDELCP
jgi:hypothetical protein